MFKKVLLIAFLSASLLSATPTAQAVDPEPSTDSTVAGLGEACGFIWGTTPCSNKYLKCCYLYPDAGYCLPACPTKYPPV